MAEAPEAPMETPVDRSNTRFDDPAWTDAEAAEWSRRRIRQLPPEVGAVLVGVGMVGVVLPGPMGTPLIIMGGLVLLPSVFGKLDHWLHRKFPRSHRVGLKYVHRFIDDFEKRFPHGRNAPARPEPGAALTAPATAPDE